MKGKRWTYRTGGSSASCSRSWVTRRARPCAGCSNRGPTCGSASRPWNARARRSSPHHPPALMAARVRARAGAASRRRAQPALAVAAGLVLVAGVAGWRALSRDPAGALDQTRVKGLAPQLLLFRKSAAGVERLSEGSPARDHDLVQMAYQAAGRRYGAVVSIDSRGVITRHLPAGAEGEAAGSRTALRWRCPTHTSSTTRRGSSGSTSSPQTKASRWKPWSRPCAARGRPRPERHASTCRRPWTSSVSCSERSPRDEAPGAPPPSSPSWRREAFASPPPPPPRCAASRWWSEPTAGAADRVPLRYAVADAERFAATCSRDGRRRARGLHRPARAHAARLSSTAWPPRARGRRARPAPRRTEVLRLLLGPRRRAGPHAGPRAPLVPRAAGRRHAVTADVGIAVLDACASGAITRLKGGRPHPAFLTDESSEMQGLRVPDLELRERGGAGVGAHPRARTSPTPWSRACAAQPTSRATAGSR